MESRVDELGKILELLPALTDDQLFAVVGAIVGELVDEREWPEQEAFEAMHAALKGALEATSEGKELMN